MTDFSSGRQWAIKVKRSLAPKLERGFHQACDDCAPSRRFVVYPGSHSYKMAENVQVLPVLELQRLLQEQTTG